MAEAVHDLVFYQGQQPHILRQYRKIVQASSPGEPGRVIGGQRKGTRRAIMIDDSPRGHRAQPLPDIPLVQRRFSCDLRARRRGHRGHDIEQTRTVADTDHQSQRGLIQHVHHPLGEIRRARGLSHPDPLSPDECDRSASMLGRTDRESARERPVLSVAQVNRPADAIEPRHRH